MRAAPATRATERSRTSEGAASVRNWPAAHGFVGVGVDFDAGHGLQRGVGRHEAVANGRLGGGADEDDFAGEGFGEGGVGQQGFDGDVRDAGGFVFAGRKVADAHQTAAGEGGRDEDATHFEVGGVR
jgi:hypothetical protein